MSEPAIDFLSAAPAVGAAEPQWLQSLRASAYDYYREHGLPVRRNENWKYTSLRGLRRQRYATVAPLGAEDEAPTQSGEHFRGLRFLNGRLHASEPMAGVSVQLMSEVLAANSQSLKDQFNALADFGEHPVATLNTAYFEDAVIVQVDTGQSVDGVLTLEFLSAPGEQPLLLCPRVLVLMGANSRLTIVERHTGVRDASNYTNAVTEIRLQAGARLDHYRVQELSPGEMATGLIAAHQARDSVLRTRCVDIGGRLVRNDLHSVLTEPGAEARMSGFYIAVERQHVDNHTRIDHLAPNTTSEGRYNGVLAGRARAVFNGKVVVAPNAQKVNAAQSNRNLLLSGTAEVDTKPELEIYADDVKCSHGATVGQIDEAALFYLRSRGVGERTARALLTFAFADEVLRDFDDAALRTYVEDAVARRLPDHERLEQLV